MFYAQSTSAVISGGREREREFDGGMCRPGYATGMVRGPWAASCSEHRHRGHDSAVVTSGSACSPRFSITSCLQGAAATGPMGMPLGGGSCGGGLSLAMVVSGKTLTRCLSSARNADRDELLVILSFRVVVGTNVSNSMSSGLSR